MDDRLAALTHEVDKIMSIGPIGRWTNPPTTFPMMSETVVFNPDGSGLITSESGMAGRSKQTFEWSMRPPGRLVMRYHGRETWDGAPEAVEEPTDEDAAVYDIEIKIQGTEFASWPVMTNRNGDVFGDLWCALAREHPPLALPQQPPVIQPERNLLSRLRDVLARLPAEAGLNHAGMRGSSPPPRRWSARPPAPNMSLDQSIPSARSRRLQISGNMDRLEMAPAREAHDDPSTCTRAC